MIEAGRADQLSGLHDRLARARRIAANDALHGLGSAIRAAFLAVALIAVAVGITWFAPTTTNRGQHTGPAGSLSAALSTRPHPPP
jgi:hypothetical protein